MVFCSWKAEWLLISASVAALPLWFCGHTVPVVCVNGGMMLNQWDFNDSR